MTATTQSDLSERVSSRDAEQAYSKSPLYTKSTTLTMIIPAGELISKSTTIAAISSSKDSDIINKHSQHGLLTPDSSQSIREDGGIIRTLMNTRTFYGKCPSKFNMYFYFHVTCVTKQQLFPNTMNCFFFFSNFHSTWGPTFFQGQQEVGTESKNGELQKTQQSHSALPEETPKKPLQPALEETSDEIQEQERGLDKPEVPSRKDLKVLLSKSSMLCM